MADDVVLNKSTIIERCLARIEEEYRGNEKDLEINLTRQDSIILNLQRACEASIDLAMHMVRVRRLGIPQQSRDAFELLREAGVVDDTLAHRMKGMVGFRNVAVHNYTALDLEIVRMILEQHLDDFREFVAAAIKSQS